MTYEEFKTEIMENIKTYLPENYQSTEVLTMPVNKSGGQYEGLLIRFNTSTICCTPVLNLNEAYDEYNKGKSLDHILKKLARTRVMSENEIPIKKEDFTEYDKIKDKIVPKLVNTENNKEYLSGKATITVEDLSVVFVVRVVQPNGIADAAITNGLLDIWNVTLPEIQKQAIKNLENAPFRFSNLVDILLGGHTPSIEEINPADYDIPIFVVSNEQNVQGAGMMLNAPLMQRIVDKFGELYIIPSSVDEVLVVPKSVDIELSTLVEMVTSINTEHVKPADRLSNNIYEYDKETGMIKLAKEI